MVDVSLALVEAEKGQFIARHLTNLPPHDLSLSHFMRQWVLPIPACLVVDKDHNLGA